MSKFIVFVREVHTQGYGAEAENEEEAKKLVFDLKGDLLEDRFEYSHTLNPETWTVERG
jgi:hypothetical protein